MLTKLKKIIAEYVEGGIEDITLSTELRGDLGLTSLELVDMSVAIEAVFHVEIPELKIVMSKTVGDIIDLLKNA